MALQNPKKLWESCQEYFKQNVGAEEYDKWFARVELESFSPASRTLMLKVPSDFIPQYIEKNHLELLRTAFINTFGKIYLKWHVNVVSQTAPENVGGSVAQAKPRNARGGSATYDANVDTETPDYKAQQAIANGQRSQQLLQAPGSVQSGNLPDIDAMLNPRQTFSNYIEGQSNRLCYSMGLNIAEHPQGTQFNPLFIYGPSGCGKTHLVNAIGVRCKELYPEKRVLYVSARTFQVQYTNAMLKNKINDFIMFYQTIDMLIVDDVQEWCTATKTQETFFHIFNHLFRLAKRIILVSDRAPVQLESMMDRLITRFSCGLVAEMEKPNVQLCVDILKRKISRDGLHIHDDVVQYIAENANGSVRDLEGVVNSLMAYSIVYNCNIDMRLVERIVKRAVKLDDQPLTIDDIIKTVCEQFNITEQSLKGRSRKRELVVPRQLVMYLADKFIRMPASRIGRLLGGRDHSTVLHSIETVGERLKTDEDFRKDVLSVEEKLGVKK